MLLQLMQSLWLNLSSFYFALTIIKGIDLMTVHLQIVAGHTVPYVLTTTIDLKRPSGEQWRGNQAASGRHNVAVDQSQCQPEVTSYMRLFAIGAGTRREQWGQLAGYR